MRFAGCTIFVTGGSGFIGSALVRHLLRDTAATVINIDKLTYASSQASTPQDAGHPNYRFVQLDICDGAGLSDLFERFQPEFVVNLAAESHVDRSIDGPAEFVQTNIVGTFTLLQETLRYWRRLGTRKAAAFRFLHVSTDEVYGSLGADGAFTEQSAYAPNSPYSASKASSDHLVRAWRETYHLPTIVTNCSNNYGPFQFPEKLIPHIILRGLGEEDLPVYGDGLNIRDWLHVEDHVRALSLVLEHARVGETYNVGGRNERTNLEVVTTVCDLLDKMRPSANGPRRRLITFVPDRPGHDRRYAIDASKIESELGWRAKETFETGIEKTIAWYLTNASWWRAIRDRGYQAPRLGLNSAGRPPAAQRRSCLKVVPPRERAEAADGSRPS